MQKDEELLAAAEVEHNFEGKKKKKTTAHVESAGFDGDRVLANEIVSLMEIGWWIEANYAIPEGDIGRVHEIFKVGIIRYNHIYKLLIGMSFLDMDILFCRNIEPKLHGLLVGAILSSQIRSISRSQ
jgi:hypothetical protein